MKPIKVLFRCDLQYAFRTVGGTTHTLTSAGEVPVLQVISSPSRPIIVTTNSNQWTTTSKILLEVDAFGSESLVGIIPLFNCLQRFFLIATQQDFLHPGRPLSLRDFFYFAHSKVSLLFLLVYWPIDRRSASVQRVFRMVWGGSRKTYSSPAPTVNVDV